MTTRLRRRPRIVDSTPATSATDGLRPLVSDGEALRARIAEMRRRWAATPITPSGNASILDSPTPATRNAMTNDCSDCGGIGWIHYDLPFGHPRYGQAVRCACQRELDARARAERARAASDAAPDRADCRFLDYDTSDNPTAVDAAKAWARGDGPPWLFMFGGYGTGKTHLLGAAFYALLDAGRPPIYTVAPLLLDYIRKGIGAEGRDEYAARFDAVRECPLLILDDLGAEGRSKWTDETLFKLVDYRYRLKLPLAVATNLRPDELEPRIASRLQDRRLSRTLVMRGRDWRLATVQGGK